MDKTATVRMSQETYDLVKSIARRKNEKIRDVIEDAVRDYTKKQFFEDLNLAYAKLKSDTKAWAGEEAEREEWDAALQDGLEAENGN